MKDKHVITILAALIIVFIGLVAAGTILTEAQRKPVLQERMAEEDLGALYNLYVNGRPALEDRAYYGEDNASITLILYTDFSSEAAKEFRNQTLRWLLDEYVHTGKAKLYHKHYLTSEDYRQQTQAYYYAQSYECYREQLPQKTYDFYFALYDTPLQDVPELAQAMGADRKAFMACIKQQAFKEVREDTTEVEQLGMAGISPWLYLGIQGRELTSFAGTPPRERLYRTIRSYQTTLGD